MHDSTQQRLRIAVVAPDALARQALTSALAELPDIAVVGWAEDAGLLLTLGTRIDVCLCTEPPSGADVGRLRERGCVVVTVDGETDPVVAVRTVRMPGPVLAVPAVVRPEFAARQQDVLIAYVTGSSLLPTVARQLGMGPETLKTHLRRIRAKYAEAGRPAPTRRDLYARALEDGLLRPPPDDVGR